MRLSTPALLVGAATVASAVGDQKVLSNPKNGASSSGLKSTLESWAKPLEALGKTVGEMPPKVRALWEEIALLVPDAFERATFYSAPKKHTRRPDSHWDHIVRGADVQAQYVVNEAGEKQRKIGGQLDTYSMRVKKVDPSSLGIDKVKQYSGYLDDEANDKHLFYCE